MAWLSVGTSNDDLVEKMQMFGVLRNDDPRHHRLIDAFLNTDRGDFVPQEQRQFAYSDRPLKIDPVHISAPHIYVTVLDALDLQPGMTFLNVGSGSGYLTCIAACLLGRHGVSHGVEINQDTVEFSLAARQRWKDRLLARLSFSVPNILPPAVAVSLSEAMAAEVSVVCGDCFDLDPQTIAQSLRYDRVYVGAGVPPHRKAFFADLLAEGGVLVMPVDEENELVQVRRLVENVFVSRRLSAVHFAPLILRSVSPPSQINVNGDGATEHGGDGDRGIESESDGERETEDEEGALQRLLQRAVNAAGPQSVLGEAYTGVTEPVRVSVRVSKASSSLPLSPLPPQSVPRRPTLSLPRLVWAPQRDRHRQFPTEFRAAVRLLLLAARRETVIDFNRGSEREKVSNKRRRASLSLCGMLHNHLWFLILSFASRDWFKPPRSERDKLCAALAVERRRRRQAEAVARERERAVQSLEQTCLLLQNQVKAMSRMHAMHGCTVWEAESDIEQGMGEEETEIDMDADLAQGEVGGDGGTVMDEERDSEEGEREGEREIAIDTEEDGEGESWWGERERDEEEEIEREEYDDFSPLPRPLSRLLPVSPSASLSPSLPLLPMTGLITPVYVNGHPEREKDSNRETEREGEGATTCESRPSRSHSLSLFSASLPLPVSLPFSLSPSKRRFQDEHSEDAHLHQGHNGNGHTGNGHSNGHNGNGNGHSFWKRK